MKNDGEAINEISISHFARKCFSAYETKERTLLEDLLSDDFTFTRPHADHVNRAGYFERCWPNSERIHALQIEKLFEGCNVAFVPYECETKRSNNFRDAEWLRFEGGKLKEIEGYFDEESQTAAKRNIGDSVCGTCISCFIVGASREYIARWIA